MKEEKTPAIRFKGFTDDWEQRKLRNIVDKAVDNRGKTPPISDDGKHPLIEVACLGNASPDYTRVEKYLDDNTFNTALRDYLKKDDILFSTVGSIGLVSLMDNNEDAAIAQNIVAFRAKNNFDAKYLYAMFSTEENQGRALRIVMGAVQPSIKVSQLADVEYYVTPDIEEQKNIGKFFYSLDNTITLHQRKYEQLQIIKKSMLENMFPKDGERAPRIRFSGFTDDWEQRKFSDMYAPVSEKNDLTYGIDKNITVATMQFKNDIKVATEEYLRTYNVCKLGDIAFEGHKSKEFQFGRFVENDIGDGIVSHIFAVFRPVSDYDLYFWKYAINNERLMAPILSRCTKASTMMNGLVTSDFMKETFLVPSVDEQRTIGLFLKNLDNTITLHHRELEKLKALKQAMLQKMFV